MSSSSIRKHAGTGPTTDQPTIPEPSFVKGSATIIVAKAGSSPVPIPPKSTTAQGTLRWAGEIPPQKWMNFYTKVLSKFVSGQGLKLTLNVEVSPEGGVSAQKIEETRVALQELGLNDDVNAGQ